MAGKKKLNKAIKKLDEMLESGVEWSDRKLQKDYTVLQKWLKELKAFREFEKQGRLLWTPCAVGDMAYFLDKCENCGEWRISEHIISDILINVDRPPLFKAGNRRGTVKLEEFGKTVFLTRREAEEELDRMEWEGA